MAKFGVQYFPDIIQAEVEAIQSDSLPRFDYGYWQEQSNRVSISGYDWQNAKTFPLIFLPVNYPEDFPEEPSYYSEVDFSLYILTTTKKNYKSSQRFEDVMKTTLYPIYENLINQMMLSLNFDKQGKRFIPHVKNDLYYFEAEINENKLNTPVEALRLDFSNLKINFISECES